MVSFIREKLKRYNFKAISNPCAICAGVMMPLYKNEKEYFIVLTKRSNEVKMHKGEVSFPGGMCEEDDGNTMVTALRECCEEIGVKQNDVEVIGRLDDMYTLTGFVITPYVGIIPYPYSFKTSPGEVAYLINLPLKHLMDVSPDMEEAEHMGNVQIVPSFHYNGDRVWGATCRLLLQFRKILNDQTI